MAYEDEDDQLPEAPVEGAPSKIDDTVDSAMFEGIGHIGDTIPAGTYVFKLESYTESWWPRLDNNKQIIPGPDTTKDAAGRDVKCILDPGFNVRWRGREEPVVGKILFDTVPWVRGEDRAEAAKGNPMARQILQERLVRMNSIIDAAGWKPNGSQGIKAFLDSGPEVKITVNETAKMSKNPRTGKWDVPVVGEKRNGVSKYLSLHRVD